MASVAINIPDSLVPRVQAAFQGKYQTTPKAYITDLIKSVVRDWEQSQAGAAAEAMARATAEADMQGVG